jgi:Fur family transcriptional regulator, ferric uptake regulator
MRLRMTNQRERILRELQASREHLTADELYGRVRKVMPRISLATVYRNLEILSATGVIGKVASGGRQKRFDYDPTEHDHVSCTICHRVDNLELVRQGLVLPAMAGGAGYEIRGFRLEIYGICPDCKRKINQQGEQR